MIKGQGFIQDQRAGFHTGSKGRVSYRIKGQGFIQDQRAGFHTGFF